MLAIADALPPLFERLLSATSQNLLSGLNSPVCVSVKLSVSSPKKSFSSCSFISSILFTSLFISSLILSFISSFICSFSSHFLISSSALSSASDVSIGFDFISHLRKSAPHRRYTLSDNNRSVPALFSR